ncbi:MFS transporter [Cryptosporangium arvum]|uniref:MFS transporter n=1 Tax=Cryptosporangium arvum TaxID=80871 RepID=UPI0004B6ED1A|nr:MFS transporter [Cryptosporangium arvum]
MTSLEHPGGPHPAAAARRARAAVAALFFTNGAVFASVVPRYPDVKEQLDLSNAALGAAVSAFWLGALLVGFGGGLVVKRWGSGRVATAVTLGACANLVVVGLAGSWWSLAAALFVAGSLDTVADIAENAHALRVERLYRRSILNSLHAVWSIGAVTGGVIGSAAAGGDVPLPVHFAIVAGVLALLASAASRFLLAGADDRPAVPVVRPGRAPAVARRWRLGAGILALGGVATLAQGIEDSGATWSGVYLREGLGAAPAVGGLAFAALQTMQTLGRLVGDRLVTRWGDPRVAGAGAALAGVAVGAALAFPSPVGTIAAFGAAGLGIATMIPAAMRGADALPGLSAGVGLSLVGSVSRIGSLLAPPMIGALADAYSVRTGLLVVPVAALLLVVLSRTLDRRP